MSISLDLLPLTATVTYKSLAGDGYGGQVATTATRQAGYACRIDQSAGDLVRLPNGQDAQSTHFLIGEPKEIHAGDRVSAGGATYEVLGPDWPANTVYDASEAFSVEVFLRSA